MEGTSETIIEASHTEATAETPRGKKRGAPGSSRGAGQKGAPQLSDAAVAQRPKVEINLHSLLEAGAHFGHQTARWSPAMAPYIYTARNGIHIINLPRTVQNWEVAKKAIESVVAAGGNVLFVGTKKQAQDAVVEEAQRCGAFYVSRRWLGGMLTNFQTIRKSIERMNKVTTILADEETLITSGQQPKFTKKERLMMSREREKLEFSLGGIKDMYSAPQVLFVIDIKREEIAIREARRLDIPVVALVDTNCDPRNVSYPIPSNDDGTRAIRLFCSAVADAVIDAKKIAVERRAHESVEARKYNAEKAAQRAAKQAEEAAQAANTAEAGGEEAAPSNSEDSAAS